MRTMQEIYDQSLARVSFTLVMPALAGGMALLLGIVGIYGVIAYAVSQRRHEIGIRVALGAQQRELKTMFVRDGVVLRVIGIAIGLLLFIHGPDPVDESNSLRHQPNRSADLHGRSDRPSRGGDPRQLHPGYASRTGRSR
jgi:hypothetical protein